MLWFRFPFPTRVSRQGRCTSLLTGGTSSRGAAFEEKRSTVLVHRGQSTNAALRFGRWIAVAAAVALSDGHGGDVIASHMTSLRR